MTRARQIAGPGGQLRLRATLKAFRAALGTVLSLACLLATVPATEASAKADKPSPTGTLLIPIAPKVEASARADKPAPTGTLLIPIAPKIDTSFMNGGRPAATPADKASAQTAQKAGSSGAASGAADRPASRYAAQYDAQEKALKPAPEKISPETGEIAPDDGATEVGEDTTLKGTIQLVADDTEFDQDRNTFLGTGNAVVLIAGENSKLEADTILYDQNSQTIDARGNVRIYRDGQLTTGGAFKFKVTSNEYLITNPDTEVEGATVVARKAVGNSSGLNFQKGTLTLPEPIHFASNAMYGPISSAEDSLEKAAHPDAFLPSKPSFKFKARKMVYERYKESGNLTVLGGRVMMGSFGIPVPKFQATVGKEDSRVMFPWTPVIGNNLNMGGISLGVSHNRQVGKTGVFSVAPLVQIGGRSLSSTGNNAGKLGAGAKISYVSDKITSHLAYGSVSNLVVGDFIYRPTKTMKVQVGVNRFLDDGMFGLRRARFMAEGVHNHLVTGIPFLSMFNFRTSAGLAQDNSALLNLTPQYAQLFNKPVVPDKKFALRVQEQITAMTHPIFNIGNDKLGARAVMYGGIGLRGYSTGDSMVMAQAGPILNVYLNRFRFQGGYTQSAVKGQSPFVFDQFIQGTRSVQVGGDVKINNYITIGGSTGYNLNAKMLYQRSITAAIGPPDLKMLFSYDTIRKNNRYGFDVIYGQPVPFNKLVLKGNPDQGQLGGI